MLLKNVLATICLNPSVKVDLAQFLRLVLKQKSGSASERQSQAEAGYQARNKVINTLTFVLKLAASQDTERFLSLFDVEMPSPSFKISDFEWNKLFLTVVGILRVLIDNNKKLVLHMLKCLIQQDEYFFNRGDHLVDSHARL